MCVLPLRAAPLHTRPIVPPTAHLKQTGGSRRRQAGTAFESREEGAAATAEARATDRVGLPPAGSLTAAPPSECPADDRHPAASSAAWMVHSIAASPLSAVRACRDVARSCNKRSHVAGGRSAAGVVNARTATLT